MEFSSIPDLPFSILALGPFGGGVSGKAPFEAVPVAPLDIDQALETVAPTLHLSLPASLCPAGSMQLTFRRMKEFSPDGLLKSQPYLQALLEADRFCKQAKEQSMEQGAIESGLWQWPELPTLSPIVERAEQNSKESSLESLLSMVDIPESNRTVSTPEAGEDSYAAIAGRILQIVYQDPVFRSLESAWQGLRYCGKSLARVGGKLTIVPVTSDEIETALQDLREMIIAAPPSTILVDHPYTSSVYDLQRLSVLAEYGQEMMVPVLAWVDYRFFQIQAWQELERLSFLPHHIEDAAFAQYRSFQRSAASRWLSLSCNRFLLRFSYGSENRSRIVAFEEQEPLWQAPVWGVATLMALRVKETGWASRMASPALVLDDLALTERKGKEVAGVEVLFNEGRLEQLQRCAIIPLAGRLRSDRAFLAGDVTVAGDASLSYQLLLSRTTHFLLLCRDAWGSSVQPDELAQQLHEAFCRFAESVEGVPIGEVDVKCRLDQGQQVVAFCWTPSAQILATGQEIVLEFPW